MENSEKYVSSLILKDFFIVFPREIYFPFLIWINQGLWKGATFGVWNSFFSRPVDCMAAMIARRPIQLRKEWREEGGLLQTVDENWKWVEWDKVRGQQSNVYSRAVCCPTRSEYGRVQQQSSSSRVSAGCDKWPPARVATLVISEQARQAHHLLLHKFSQQSNNSQTVELWDSFEREEKSAGDSLRREAAVELLQVVVVVAGKRCGQEGS